MWASASVGLTSALIVCTVLFLRTEPREDAAAEALLAQAATRWRDSITTRNLAMAGV